MSNELRPCHRCGTPAAEYENSYGHRIAYYPLTRCSNFKQEDYVDDWNHLPIEDALRAEVARKDAEIKILTADRDHRDVLLVWNSEEIAALDELVEAEREGCCFYSNIAATLESAVNEAGFKLCGETAEVSEGQQQILGRIRSARARLAAVRGEPCLK